MSAENTPNERDELELITKWMIAEYERVTDEMLELSKGGYQILLASSGLAGAALTAGAVIWTQPIPSSLIFNVIVPLIMVGGFSFWVRSSLSAKDAAGYVTRFYEGRVKEVLDSALERRLENKGTSNKYYIDGHPVVIGWETWHDRLKFSERYRQRDNRITTIIGLLIGFGFIISIALGEINSGNIVKLPAMLWLIRLLPVVPIALAACICVIFLRERNQEPCSPPSSAGRS